MTAIVLAARKANVTDNTDEAAAGYECVVAAFPNLVQLVEERFVVFDVSELTLAVAVLLERSVWRGRDDQMYGLGSEK